MKKWFFGLAGLGALSVAAVAVMSALVMAGVDDQPAQLEMALGQPSDFSPVALTGRMSDTNSLTTSWWEQTLTFGEDVQTESRFHSGFEDQNDFSAELDRTSVSLWSEDAAGAPDLMNAFDDGRPVGRYLISDYIERYSYSLDFRGEAMGLGFDVPFPWLWSKVGEADCVEVDGPANSPNSTTTVGIYSSVVSAKMTPIRLDGGWAFTLSNLFHGSRASDPDTGEQQEVLQYGGSSGIFFVATDENGAPEAYDEMGQTVIQQLYDIPISSERDTIVLRLDWMPKRGLLCLLVSQSGQLELHLFDPASQELRTVLPLGPSVLGNNADALPDSCYVRIQGDLMLVLQGEGTGKPSRALVVQVDSQGSPTLLQDSAFDTSLYFDDYLLNRSDEGMLWRNHALYVLEIDDFWSSCAMLYAVGEDGLTAVGVLQNAGGAREEAVSFYRYREESLPFVMTPNFTYRGWGELSIRER